MINGLTSVLGTCTLHGGGFCLVDQLLLERSSTVCIGLPVTTSERVTEHLYIRYYLLRLERNSTDFFPFLNFVFINNTAADDVQTVQ